jgi:hypothetical protein
MRSIGTCILAAALLLAGTSCDRSMRPATTDRTSAHEQLPTPATYVATCRLVASWCKPMPGRVPTALRRPLHLPKPGPSGGCPTSSGRSFSNNQFGGIALGSGPVRPLIAARGGDAKHGILTFSRTPDTRPWWAIKTLWFSYPRYQGPLFIRGRRLGSTGKLVFGEGPSLIDPQLPPEPTINGTNGWREWPGGTFIRTFGCYAWQIDGTNFSTVIVFKAIRRRG